MPADISNMIHYNTGSECQPMMITADDLDGEGPRDGIVFTTGLLGALVTANHTGIEHSASSSNVSDTWHRNYECWRTS